MFSAAARQDKAGSSSEAAQLRSKMATTLHCRVQYLDDTEPFNATNFPEPTRPPTYTFLTNVPLINQIGGVKRLLKAPHKVSEVPWS